MIPFSRPLKRSCGSTESWAVYLDEGEEARSAVHTRERTLTFYSLINMRSDCLPINHILSHTFLVNTHSGEHRQRPAIDLHSPIRDDAHNDLLPPLFAPCLGSLTRAEMRNVGHYAVHCSCEELFVFLEVLEKKLCEPRQAEQEKGGAHIVHGHADEQLGPSGRVKEDLPESIALILHIVRIARSRRIAHVRKLPTLPIIELIQQLARHRAVEHEISMIELYPLERLVSPRHSLRNPPVSDTSRRFSIFQHGRVESARHVACLAGPASPPRSVRVLVLLFSISVLEAVMTMNL